MPRDLAKTAVTLSGRDATCSTVGKEGESEDLEPQPLRAENAENAETPWDREPSVYCRRQSSDLAAEVRGPVYRRVQ